MLYCLQQERHHATHTKNAYFTSKNHRPTEHANGRPILRRRREGTQIYVASLLKPKSLVLWWRRPTHLRCDGCRLQRPEGERAPLAGRLVGREGGSALSAQIRWERGAAMPNRLDPPTDDRKGRGRWRLGTRLSGREAGHTALRREEEASDACRDCSVGGKRKRVAQASGALLFWVHCWKTTNLGA